MRRAATAAKSPPVYPFSFGTHPCDSHICYLINSRDASVFIDSLPPLPRRPPRPRRPETFLRLDDCLPVALEETQIFRSDVFHFEECSTRHVGKDRRPQHFYVMLGAIVVAHIDGRHRVLPRMPQFVEPKHDSDASSAATNLCGYNLEAGSGVSRTPSPA